MAIQWLPMTDIYMFLVVRQITPCQMICSGSYLTFSIEYIEAKILCINFCRLYKWFVQTGFESQQKFLNYFSYSVDERSEKFLHKFVVGNNWALCIAFVKKAA